MKNNVPHLAITDADAIHEYVFSPHELRLVRGGSRLQRQLNDEAGALAGRFDGETIFAGGGTVLAEFPNKTQADAFCREVAELYRKKTVAATISAATIAYPNRDEFARVHAELRNELERKKQTRPGSGSDGGSPFWVSCEACGRRPASGLAPTDKKRICEACRLREESGQRERGSAADFQEIGQEAQPENYLAIVYIDVDRLGNFLQRYATTKPVYRTLSEKIKNAVRQSVERGFGGVPKREELLVGGDDAIVAVPAQYAIGFLRRFAKHFRAADFSPAPARPTFSAGLVIAHSHYPIAEFVRIADDLLKSAKRLKDADAVDFEIVTTSMTGHVVKQRETADGRERTGRPYVLGDVPQPREHEKGRDVESFLELVAAVRGLKQSGAPLSQVKALYQIAYKGVMQSELEYLDLLSRVEPEVRRKLLRAVGPRLWKQQDGRAFTTAADLVELWEFIDASETDD